MKVKKGLCGILHLGTTETWGLLKYLFPVHFANIFLLMFEMNDVFFSLFIYFNEKIV